MASLSKDNPNSPIERIATSMEIALGMNQTTKDAKAGNLIKKLASIANIEELLEMLRVINELETKQFTDKAEAANIRQSRLALEKEILERQYAKALTKFDELAKGKKLFTFNIKDKPVAYVEEQVQFMRGNIESIFELCRESCDIDYLQQFQKSLQDQENGGIMFVTITASQNQRDVFLQLAKKFTDRRMRELTDPDAFLAEFVRVGLGVGGHQTKDGVPYLEQNIRQMETSMRDAFNQIQQLSPKQHNSHLQQSLASLDSYNSKKADGDKSDFERQMHHHLDSITNSHNTRKIYIDLLKRMIKEKLAQQ